MKIKINKTKKKKHAEMLINNLVSHQNSSGLIIR